MKFVPKALTGRESPRGLEYVAMIISAAIDKIDYRDLVAAGAAAIILTAGAQEAVEKSWVAPVTPDATADHDPVLVEVGAVPIRVSDARAQAVLTETVADAAALPPEALFRSGLVDEAADQTALAKAAIDAQLHKSLEIRAELALARRRILSSAYLDLAVRQQVTEETVRSAYDHAARTAAADQVIEVRRILVSSRDEALALKEKIDKGLPFSNLARRQSLDLETRNNGGLVGRVRLSELPETMAAAVRDLPLDTASAPVKGENGWYLISVDGRSAVRLPPFDEMRPQIEAQLKDAVVADTVKLARSAVPIRLASTIGPSSGTASVASIAVSAW